MVKPFNEDRLSIVPKLSADYPDISIFAVYDGHGGSGCADFLKEHIPKIILKQDSMLRVDPENSLKNAFKEAEDEFMRRNDIVIKDRSGSCACLLMFIGDQLYIANVGDSRAIMSMNDGNKSMELSKDHKPGEESEKRRIILGGGQLYQNGMPLGMIT
jgi:protein phosphatase PTC2/3